MVGFPRAWSVLQRTLNIAEFKVNDFDRERGVFITEIESDEGFLEEEIQKKLKFLLRR